MSEREKQVERQPKDRSFLREWASDPLRVAAIAPSGRSLARIITCEVGAETGPIIELGPGTGVFTQALLDRGVPPENLALVELSAAFSQRLRRKFPDVQVFEQSAADLDAIDPFDGKPAGAVISGLGLLAMPEDVVSAILEGAFNHLAPGAALYQFTYAFKCPVPPGVMASHGLQFECIGRTLRNLPPASVYKITKA